MAGRRGWTLEGARELLPDVRERTARAVEEADAILARREALAAGSPDREVLDEELREVVEADAGGAP